MSQSLDIFRRVIDTEAQAILDLKEQIDASIEQIIEVIMTCKGKVVFIGIGKSGLIARKIAATFASTGTPSFFIHPGEAFHGDLGMVRPDDLIVLLSNSGETVEILKLIPFFKENHNQIIAITGNLNSTLARNADFTINSSVRQEACPLQLAPTSSTTATLVIGDALAVALMETRNFTPEDFARFHPGGNLGKLLLNRVEQLMQTDNLPIVALQADLSAIVGAITAGRRGIAIVMDNNKIAGIITDGDLRRALQRPEVLSLRAYDIATHNPKYIHRHAKLYEAEELMNNFKIITLLVSPDGSQLDGLIQIFDINNTIK